MTEDFYDHMKKEQELLDLSYRESLRQKAERMAVWDPQDKMAENSQIKTLIIARYQAFKTWVVGFIPGF
jgi:adenine deaminase